MWDFYGADPEWTRPVTSGAASARKVSKPEMEKRRRQRINRCLEQLESLLKEHSARHIRKRKLEKADILEMTVKHVRSLQQSQRGSTAHPGPAQHRAQFRTCLAAVNWFVWSPEGALA